MSHFFEQNYKAISGCLVTLFLLYIYSMFLYPWYEGCWDWKYVHAVWYDWQALNVGLLAFASTIVLFNISRYQAHQQKERQLIAAKAFMPEALSELSEYCAYSSAILKHLYLTFQAERENEQQFNRLREFKLELPKDPIKYREVFSKCISLADHQLSEYLAYILSCMQVQNSRLSGMRDKYIGENSTLWGKGNTLHSMLKLCELQILINNLYSYARGEVGSFTPKKLDLGSFQVAILTLNLLTYEVELMDLAKSILESKNEVWRLD